MKEPYCVPLSDISFRLHDIEYLFYKSVLRRITHKKSWKTGNLYDIFYLEKYFKKV